MAGTKRLDETVGSRRPFLITRVAAGGQPYRSRPKRSDYLSLRPLFAQICRSASLACPKALNGRAHPTVEGESLINAASRTQPYKPTGQVLQDWVGFILGFPLLPIDERDNLSLDIHKR